MRACSCGGCRLRGSGGGAKWFSSSNHLPLGRTNTPTRRWTCPGALITSSCQRGAWGAIHHPGTPTHSPPPDSLTLLTKPLISRKGFVFMRRVWMCRREEKKVSFFRQCGGKADARRPPGAPPACMCVHTLQSLLSKAAQRRHICAPLLSDSLLKISHHENTFLAASPSNPTTSSCILVSYQKQIVFHFAVPLPEKWKQ